MAHQHIKGRLSAIKSYGDIQEAPLSLRDHASPTHYAEV